MTEATICGRDIEIGKGEFYWVCDLPPHEGVIHETEGKQWRDPDHPYVPDE